MDWKKIALFMCMDFLLVQAFEPKDPAVNRLIDILCDSRFKSLRNVHKSNGDNRELIVLELYPFEKTSDTVLPQLRSGRRLKNENTIDKFKPRLRYHYSSDSSQISSSLESSEDSSSSSFERNTDNPYSVYKDKYYQNYLWNHAMTGDHMNIYPTAPKFKSPGPSGADLFFGRKWWYFNQDDYMPLG